MTINDCFAQPQKLLPVSEALAQLRAAGQPMVTKESVSLRQAQGRILAEPLISGRDIPGFNNAAVDGYAINAADLNPQQATQLPLVGQATAGHASAEALKPGTAMRILTGAKMPDGADTVVMQENANAGGIVGGEENEEYARKDLAEYKEALKWFKKQAINAKK